MQTTQADTWHITGRYRSYELPGSLAHAARGAINLVNVQGPGPIAVLPCCLHDLGEYLDQLDPTRSWRSWWELAAGEPVEIREAPPLSVPVPYHPLPKTLAHAGEHLGINVGGHYLRLAWLADGAVKQSSTIRLGSGRENVLANATAADFATIVRREHTLSGLKSIGIAWSAPRTAIGLRAMSIPMENAGELSGLLDTGRLDHLLTEQFGVPVFSWNDGEAVAAAEWLFRLDCTVRPLLALKLGTSMASGIATSEGVCKLPMQLAKFLLGCRPSRQYRHPQTGLVGTARDSIGAEPIVRTYRTLTAASDASYQDFCRDALAGVSIATRLLLDAASAIAEITEIISHLWSPVDLVVTGKNLEEEDFRHLFTAELARRLPSMCPGARFIEPTCDCDLVAAIGAVCLSVGQSEQLDKFWL